MAKQMLIKRKENVVTSTVKAGKVALTLLCCSLLTGCSSVEEEFTADVFAMDTFISLRVWGDQGQEAVREASNYLYALEAEFSATRSSSTLYQINKNPNQWNEISSDMEEILLYSIEMKEDTQGAYDPTVQPLIDMWGFTNYTTRVPSQEEIQDILPVVNASLLQIEDGKLWMEEGMSLNLGAIAKGYAADKMAEDLKSRGVKTALLYLGGNIYALGEKVDGSPWIVGVQNPYGAGSVGNIYVTDTAVVTSGGYQRYFVDEESGETYWHIIDPSTGYPSTGGLASVTIVDESAMRGDVLSTALFVMGLEGAIDYWGKHRDFDMILIAEDGDVYITAEVLSSFTLSKGYTQGEVKVIS